MKIKYKLDEGAFPPSKAHKQDAGLDLRTPYVFSVLPHCSFICRTGIHVEIPTGYCGVLISKSGLMTNNDITSHGLIDAGYTGEIYAMLFNHGNVPKVFEPNDAITQLVILPIPDIELEKVDEIKGGERGANGFGSSER